MTKKDYELIASVLQQEYADDQRAPERTKIREIAYSLATALRHTNPHFDFARFIDACGVEY